MIDDDDGSQGGRRAIEAWRAVVGSKRGPWGLLNVVRDPMGGCEGKERQGQELGDYVMLLPMVMVDEKEKDGKRRTKPIKNGSCGHFHMP